MRRFWKGRSTVDDADLSQDRAEREAPYLLAASRKPTGPTASRKPTCPTGPTATGRCLFCDEIVADDQRWCDTACHFEEVREMLRGGVR